VIRIGSRGSLLALWQAEHVKVLLEGLGHAAEIQVISTTGDRNLEGPLQPVGGKGAFLKEIEEALLREEVDLAVHSLKDVPTAHPDGLRLCAILERADPRDALVSADGNGLRGLRNGARVGTTSLRRQAQLRIARPDLVLADLRGNVDTRLRRLREGHYDAIVLAVAGLSRLGRFAAVSEVLDVATVCPAPGQGAIALECRTDDGVTSGLVAPLDHAPTRRAITAERAFLAALGGGCNVPLGAHAHPREDGSTVLRLAALVASRDGRDSVRGEATGEDPEALGAALAADFLARDARRLLGA
jgi:hydroxymethylbilane synthase